MNIPAKKSLGQNFLKDETILQKIAESISTTSEDLIIEIGPGKGALTKYLVQKPSSLLCYEIDERMRDVLSVYESDKCRIFFQDFLQSDLNNVGFSYTHLYVMANIPYYITTPILTHILESNVVVCSMILLVQKEVALRFSAKPQTSDYGYFTVLLNHFYHVEYLFDVPSTSFSTPPKVTSSVIKLVRKESIVDLDFSKFSMFIGEAFSQKRKTLKNNLRNYDFNKISEVFISHNLPLTSRAEEISYDVFLELFFKLVL